MSRPAPSTWLAAFVFLVALTFIAYGTERHETTQLLATYTVLFALYLWIIAQKSPPLRFWMVTAVILRLVLLPAVPALSDDFYRFIWDGRIWLQGFHPFVQTPAEWMAMYPDMADADLYERLNSQPYFTVYPPLPQLSFVIAAWLFPESVYGSMIVLKVFNIGAELGTLFLLSRLLKKVDVPASRILWYALNPLVILEITANLHHEGWLVFFVLTSVYLLAERKYVGSAVAFAGAIASKLIPAIFLPFIFFRLGRTKENAMFMTTLSASLLVLFLPMFNLEFIQGFKQGLGYYFQKFEFNASLYYLWRQWGYWYYGHNIIGNIGWRLGVMALVVITIFAYVASRRTARTGDEAGVSVMSTMWAFQFMLLTYFLCVTILHPWYIISLLVFSIFTGYRFAISWTFLIFLTYSGYSIHGFQENLYLTAFEYMAMGLFLLLDIRHEISQRKA